ncbi:MAG TPA: GIY-YIG nuclease family protein [Candidatus Gastranaerophilaceae bacterium]|nr:GIY-YIG nuclease family protein [Candidatus Gastranaerophilaceae bacterium]
MTKQSYVYIMTNYNETVLYTGITSDLIKRVYEHKNKLREGFTKNYNVTKLVYFECFDNIENAIIREKQIKAGSRNKKLELIKKFNPDWIDLYDKIV